MDTGNTSLESSPPPPYRSATSFNLTEALIILAGAVMLVVFSAIPLLANTMRRANGIDVDIFKEIPPSSTPQQLICNAGDISRQEMLGNGVDVQYLDQSRARIEMFSGRHGARERFNQRWGGEGYPAWPADVSNVNMASGAYEHVVRGKFGSGVFIEWINEPFLFHYQAADNKALDLMISGSPYIDRAGDPGYNPRHFPLPLNIMYHYPLVFCILLGALIVGFMWLIFGTGLMIARRRPPKGIEPVDRKELRDRLLALNNPESDFVIEEVAPFHLVGRWRLDQQATYFLFAREKVTEAYQLDLYIHRNGRVGALETRGTISWDTSVVPPRASYRWNMFRGVVLFEMKTVKRWGFDPGLRFTKTIDYSFNAGNYKQPVVKTIVGSGWVFQPVILRPVIWFR